MKPVARKGDIFAENLPEEVILYNKTNNKVHCLGKTAAVVWESCDGTRMVDDLAQTVRTRFGRRRAAKWCCWLSRNLSMPT
jgi:hypothetical protein